MSIRTGFDSVYSNTHILPYIGNRNGHTDWYFSRHTKTALYYRKAKSSRRENAGKESPNSNVSRLIFLKILDGKRAVHQSDPHFFDLVPFCGACSWKNSKPQRGVGTELHHRRDRLPEGQQNGFHLGKSKELKWQNEFMMLVINFLL